MLRYFRPLRTASKGRSRHLSFESLESKRLLAIDVIWTNEFTDDGSDLVPQFDDYYQQDEQIARDIVNRAITDWEAVIDSFNDASNPTDTFDLTVLAVGPGDADEIAGRGAANPSFASGKPVSATIRMDDNGGGTGWFFDQTPHDDIEFTSIADTFQSSFINATTAGQARQNDFYRTITHEIGHAMGVLLRGATAATSNNNFSGLFGLNSGQAVPPSVDIDTGSGIETLPSGRYDAIGLFSKTTATVAAETQDALLGNLNFVGVDQVDPVRFDQLLNLPAAPGDPVFVVNELWRYDFQNTPGRSVTFTESGGGHFYEGPINGNTPGATAHPNELMNAGRTVPAGSDPAETTRQFISDLTVEFLEDAYGYTVTLPSTLDTAHAVLDSHTGQLLVQGLPGAVNETIAIDTVGTDIRVVVGNTTELIPQADVTQILIAGNGGTDTITVNVPGLTETLIDYVVSSNEDALEAAGQSTSDGIVDISTIIPGNQTTLRAAIIETDARADSQAIYLGRGVYTLGLTGAETSFDGSVNDLDVFGMSTLSIIGAGAGLTVIDGGGNDRIFDVAPGGVDRVLDLSRVTLTGGQTTAGGFTGYGGAVRVGDEAGLRITDSALIGNAALNSYGGAVTVVANGTAIIERSVFSNNQAGVAGGAIALMPDHLGVTGISQVGSSQLAGNTANGAASSIYAMENELRAVSLGNNLTDVDGTIFSASFFQAPNDHIGSVDYLVTNIADRLDATDGGLGLREAVLAANANPNSAIWVPAWDYRLVLTGTEPMGTWNAAVNDLDITGDVTIVGAGAGLTVIDGGGIDRVFDLLPGSNALDLSRVTLTGGRTTGAGIDGYGGAIRVGDEADLVLTDSALVGNESVNSYGGAIGVSGSGIAKVERSVFYNNQAGADGGAIALMPPNSLTRRSEISTSVFAGNTVGGNLSSVVGTQGQIGISLGNNLTDVDGLIGTASFFQATGDHIGSVDFVVTSVADRIGGNDGGLSLREAVIASNANDNVTEEIWLPAWDFVLTRDRTTYGVGTTDTDASFGDLDISDSLFVRGISGLTSVAWRAEVNDAVFDLLGDFTGDGITSPDDGDIDGFDFSAWQQQNGSGSVDPDNWGDFSADGDDDGDVDADDLAVWSANYGNTLLLDGVL